MPTNMPRFKEFLFFLHERLGFTFEECLRIAGEPQQWVAQYQAWVCSDF